MNKETSTIRLSRSLIRELIKMRESREDYNSVVSRLVQFFKHHQVMEVKT